MTKPLETAPERINCPLCGKPLEVHPNGYAMCRNLKFSADTVQDWTENSCPMAAYAVMLVVDIWRALNTRTGSRVADAEGKPPWVDQSAAEALAIEAASKLWRDGDSLWITARLEVIGQAIVSALSAAREPAKAEIEALKQIAASGVCAACSLNMECECPVAIARAALAGPQENRRLT